jgi:hypothetical protein
MQTIACDRNPFPIQPERGKRSGAILAGATKKIKANAARQRSEEERERTAI